LQTDAGDPTAVADVGDGRDAPLTAAAALARATATLAAAGVDSPRADARWLLLHVLNWSATDLVRESGHVLDTRQARTLRHLLARRAAREPLQLVLGGTEFRGHRIALRPGVFIPRPETELLVEHALRRLPDDGVVAEPCTGSGAVACAIALERPGTRVIATDVDGTAVQLAGANAARLGAPVQIHRGTLLEPLPADLRGRLDMVVCNPPYLTAAEVADLPPEVADWDPVDALVAGTTGHEVSDRLIALGCHWLRPRGWLVLELDERRVTQAAERADAAGLVEIEVEHDLTRRPRFLVARRP
jgi:release factor glutamine methyltransferase